MVSPSPVFTFKKYKKKSPRICTWKDLENEKKDNTGTYYPYRSRIARLPLDRKLSQRTCSKIYNQYL